MGQALAEVHCSPVRYHHSYKKAGETWELKWELKCLAGRIGKSPPLAVTDRSYSAVVDEAATAVADIARRIDRLQVVKTTFLAFSKPSVLEAWLHILSSFRFHSSLHH